MKAPRFQPVAQSTLDAWAHRLNEAMVNADRAYRRFQSRTEELNQHFVDNPKLYLDEMVKRDKLIYDPERRDALDDYTWNQGEALRVAARIQAEYHLRELQGRGYVRPSQPTN